MLLLVLGVAMTVCALTLRFVLHQLGAIPVFVGVTGLWLVLVALARLLSKPATDNLYRNGQAAPTAEPRAATGPA
jgi:hypothetical protein